MNHQTCRPDSKKRTPFAATGNLFVSAGNGPGDFGGDPVYLTEIVQLSHPPSHPNTLPCDAEPADFPTISSGASSTFIGGRPLVCGGSNVQSGCREFLARDNTWDDPEVEFTEGMSPTNAARVNEREWWLTSAGGSTDVYTEEDGIATKGALPPPWPRANYALTRISDTQVMMTGGRAGNSEETDEAWIYDSFLDEWTEIESFAVARENHVAGLVQGTDGSKYVVIAGGFDMEDGLERSAEVYSLRNQTWTKGPDLPFRLHRPEVVPYEWSFLIVGGYVNGTYSDNIVYFDPVTFDWVVLPDKLQQARASHIVMVVPKDYCFTIQSPE